jgi:hypothetical protein
LRPAKPYPQENINAAFVTETQETAETAVLRVSGCCRMETPEGGCDERPGLAIARGIEP